MIIDKLEPFWTEEHERKRIEILDAMEAFTTTEPQYTTEDYNNGKVTQEYLDQRFEAITSFMDKQRDLEDLVKKDYFDSFSADPTGLYKEIGDIVDALEKEDFLEHLKEVQQDFIRLKERLERAEDKALLSPGTLSFLEETCQENWYNARNFIRSQIVLQIEGLVYYGLDVNKANTSAEEKASVWYIQHKQAYLPLAHGKVTDAFAYMNSKSAVIDDISKTATIEKNSVKLTISNFIDKKTSLGINTDKLLTTAIALFTQHNDFRGNTEPSRIVTFPLKDYVRVTTGDDLIEHKKATPEETAKEKKRVKHKIDNARKAVKKDLDLLHASTLEWRESLKSGDYHKVSLVTQTGIRNGIITVALSPEFAGYLAERNLITQYPTALLGIDARDPNTYYLGRKMAEHYNMDSNQKKGNHNRLSVQTLLGFTNLPTFEEVQAKDRGHWERKLKEPLEVSLDKLVNYGVLTSWKYTHSKGKDLTDEEAYNITSYYDFIGLYIEYSLVNAVNHTARIERKEASKEKRKTKRAK